VELVFGLTKDFDATVDCILVCFLQKIFWFIEIKEGGGSFYIEGGGVQVIRRIKKRGWGRLTCFGFALTPGAPYVLLNNWISGITGITS
jgi:hypothetical protein